MRVVEFEDDEIPLFVCGDAFEGDVFVAIEAAGLAEEVVRIDGDCVPCGFVVGMQGKWLNGFRGEFREVINEFGVVQP